MLPPVYVAPKVDQVVSEEELSRELLYAGNAGGSAPLPPPT